MIMTKKKIKNFKDLFRHFLSYFGIDRKRLKRNNYWKILFITFVTQFFWLALIYQFLTLMLPFLEVFNTFQALVNSLTISYFAIKLLDIVLKDSPFDKIYYIISGRFLYNFNLPFLIKCLSLLFFANIVFWFIIPVLIKKFSPIYSKKQ